MSYYTNVQKALDYIEEHAAEKLGIDRIARVAGYSIPHFYRVFGAIVGCSVSEYLRRRRLSRAAYDVAATRRSITEIAFEHGFESHEVFTRTFKTEGTLNGEKLDCDVYDFIDGVWLPNSGLELSDAPDFELILEKDRRVEYYISIR